MNGRLVPGALVGYQSNHYGFGYIAVLTEPVRYGITTGVSLVSYGAWKKGKSVKMLASQCEIIWSPRA